MLSATEHGPNTTSVRDLTTYLDCIWQRHFSDIPRVNEVDSLWPSLETTPGIDSPFAGQ